MQTSHSLPYAAAAPVPNYNRPSALPSSLSTPSAARFEREDGSGAPTRLRNPVGHGRSGSGTLRIEPQSPSRGSFTLASPPRSPPPHLPTVAASSSGVIPASSSFFRPSRPHTFAESRRSSTASSLRGTSPPPGTNNFPLQPLAYDLDIEAGHAYAYDSDFEAFSDAERAGGRASRLSSAEDGNSTMPRQRNGTTYSREPLIPAGRSRAGTATSNVPSLARKGSDRRQQAGVRQSIERFSRGLSLDFVRRSISAPSSPWATSPSAGGYEPKRSDSGEVMHLKPELARPRWDPRPPENLPHPLNRTPKTTDDGGRLVRNYELHPSKNKYSLRGRLLIGGDKPYAFLFTLTILLGLGGTWFATTCRWWWTNLSPALAGVGIYIFLLCISLFAVTSFSDPGILPRELDLDPPYPAETPGSEGRQPYPREVKVRAGSIRVKWCTTCKTYRPPRSSHCRLCDNCVDGCDHHCQWVNNCVGRRNYTTFFALITSGTLTLIMVIVSSAIHLYLLAQRNSWSFAHALRTGAGSAVCFSLAIILIFPVAALLFYHVRLLLLNITTIEQIRVTAHKRLVPNAAAPPNPFSHGGWRRNLAAVLCRPPGMSWIDLPGVATEDRRTINPAYAGAEDGWVGGRE